MELDQVYRKCGADLVVLELSQVPSSDLRSLIDKLVRKCNKELSEDGRSLEKLEAFRRLLCCEYQLSFGPDQKSTGARRTGCLRGIRNLLLAGRRLCAPIETVRDIVVLQIVLYCEPECVGQHVVDVGDPSSCANNKEERVFRVQVIEGILEAIRLRRILYGAENEQTCEDIASTFLTNAAPWLSIEQRTDWPSFASLFGKLRDVFGPENILIPVWNILLDKRNDLADTLNGLCVTCDVYFPLDTEKLTSAHCALCWTPKLWSLISEGLGSPVQQHRKRALFVMRRATEFISKMDGERVSEEAGLVPFFTGSVPRRSCPITGFRERYFLLMEALEEKQYRLVAPVLSHLPVLLKDCQEHGPGEPWISILLKKVLSHENAKVRRVGISRLCQFDQAVLDRRILEVFVNGLNGTILYKTESYGEPPGLMEELVGLFVRAMEKDRSFGSSLLERIVRVEPNWGRVPLLYLVVALRRAVSKLPDCPFQLEELTAIKCLARKYSGAYCPTLRSIFETELIRTITKATCPIQDVASLMEVLWELSVYRNETWFEYRWNLVTDWLGKVVNSSAAVDYVRETCRSYTERNNIREGGVEKFALAVALLHDAGIITMENSSYSREILNDWFSSVNGIQQRPYADLEATLDVTEMIARLIELEAMRTKVPLARLYRPYVATIMNFLLKAMRNVPSRLDYKDLTRYLYVLRTFLENKARLMTEKQETDYLENFRIESRSLLNQITDHGPMHCLCALYVLWLTQERLRNECYGKILRLVPEIKSLEYDESCGVASGRLASGCYEYVARILCQSLSRNLLAKTEPEQLKELLASLSELLDIGGREVVAQIGSVLSAIVDQNGVKEETRPAFEAILAASWRSVFLERHSPQFLAAARILADVVVGCQRLTTTPSELIDQLLNECEDIPAVQLHMLEKTIENGLCATSLPNCRKLLLSCILYGHAPTKDKRIERELYVYMSKNNFSPAGVDTNDERLIRAGGMNGIYQIISRWPMFESCTPLLELFTEALNKHAGKRYHSQSDVHRTKHRLMQAILILEPKLTEEDAAVLAKDLTRLIVLDSDQPSVRLMQEWTLVRIFQERSQARKVLWQFFEQAMKERPRCTISAAKILYHLAPLLTEQDFEPAFQYLSQCSFGSQFDMRLYNQVAFERVYQCLKDNSHDLARYEFLYEAIAKSLEESRSKIAEDFFLYKLRPVEDYSFETILYELPRLSGMDSYEWIEPGLFEIGFEPTSQHPLKLRNTDSPLTGAVPSFYKTSREEETGCEVGGEVGLVDVQKKIDPTSYLTQLDPSTSINERGGITVVGSLMECRPNLGGLARTCEIFRARELVIGNYGDVREKEFQNLSVSADKWIKITEVKPSMLQDYLLGKKEQGWSLVGAEQTANSVPLQEARFSERTVLVLGNEKTGIPANLIPLLDTCIEIPQLGVTRSLNVHVTGAICVWEYTKQHSLP